MVSIQRLLFRPTDIAFLAYFRVFSGGFIAGEMINQLFTDDYLNYTKPAFHFTYQLFSWMPVLPENAMFALFGIIIMSAIMVALGWMYRISSIALFLSYTVLFLMEKSEYVNHFYLYCIITFLLILLPAHKAFSMDAASRRQIRINTVPAWNYLILIFMISIVYFYAGIAKLHPDWLEARAMKLWLSVKGDTFLIGPLLTKDFMPWIICYGGMIFDLFIVPALLWRKSRVFAFIVACCFHLSNVMIFGLATFPWFSMMMTALFFGPSWPRKLPVFRSHLPDFTNEPVDPTSKQRILITTSLSVFVFLNLLIPFRHFLYPGSPNWTEEGHRFSWHMMLRAKQAETIFFVLADGQQFGEYGDGYLTAHQLNKMSGNPEMILEFAQFLKKHYRELGFYHVEVRVNSMAGLNGREMQIFIDPTVDLGSEKRSLGHYDWILPMKD